MSMNDRESSRDREMVVRHQPSFSDSGRSSVPMWDSSDPERAPPPLPLNPGSNSPMTTKNASATVTAAAEAIAARARENMFIAQSIQARSPERALMKGQFQKRLTSMQPGGVKDLSTYLENPKSPEKVGSPDKARSPERPPARSPERALERASRSSTDFDRRSPDRSLAWPHSPTPASRSTPKEESRPSSRREFKPILGETPPQSATMKALQSAPITEPDRLTKSNSDSAAVVRAPQSFEAISNQILGLTSIATRLQQEMAALSRRSKDNATDLVSLKEATNARDEDIRKSLRDLVSNVGQNLTHQSSRPYLPSDIASSPSITKSAPLPRMASPASFASTIDRDLISSPTPYSTDGAAAIALLEKILREMATKEGHEQLLASVSHIADKSGAPQTDSKMAKHLEEVIGLLKDHATSSRALVRSSFPPPPNVEPQGPHYGSAPNSPHGGPLARTSRNITPRGPPPMTGPGDRSKPFPGPRPGDFVNDEVFKILKRLKDSVAEGGGMSAEIKALVRELRGEVLGMGREIARKLDQASNDRDSDTGNAQPSKDDIAKVVHDGLEKLKDHFEQANREMRRQSISSNISKTTVDSREVHNAVRSALKELPPLQRGEGSGIQREEILDAVREAWETYKPEIEMQHFGLERDEILQCLKEGLEDYRQRDSPRESDTYERVLDAVRDGLKDFRPSPLVEAEASITREEIVMTIKESLEAFERPDGGFGKSEQIDMIRMDVLDAVREGLSQQPTVSKEIEFNREDLFDAVRAGLESAPGTMSSAGEHVVEKLQYLIDNMRDEFQQYSSANGRDTDQVLDAMKDGMETLRSSIETYVDRAADVTGKDEIIDTVRSGLENLRIDLETSISNAPRSNHQGSNSDLLDAMEKEFEHLRSTISSSVNRNSEGSIGGREELLDAIREGFDELKDGASKAGISSGSGEMGTVLGELQHLRTTLAANLTRGGGAVDREEVLDAIRDGIDRAQLGLSKDKGRPESVLSSSSELLEVFNESLDNLKSDIERIVNKPIDMTVNYEILDTLKEGLSSLRKDFETLRNQRPRADTASTKRGGEVVIADENAAMLHPTNMEKLEVMMTQLKMKVESLDGTYPSAETSSRSDLGRFETALKDTQGKLSEIVEKSQSQQSNCVTKEDTDAIETLLRNTKAMIEEMDPGEPIARAHHFESLEALVRGTKDAVNELNSKQESETASKADLALLEVLIKDLQTSMQDNSSGGSIPKDDFESLADMCTETQNLLKDIAPESDGLASKSDVTSLQDLIEEFQESVNSNARLQAQAFDARKTEHGGLADKIEDTKSFLEAVRSELKEAVQGNQEGIEGLNEALSAIGEAVTGETMMSAIKSLADNIEAEFSKAHANQDASKTDMEIAHKALFEKHDDNKLSLVTDLTSKIDERFDELMTKYDDAQGAAARKEEILESKTAEQVEVLTSAKATAEDLKILIDTLGTTVTDTCERVTDDNKTVYNKVDELGSKMEQTVQLLGPDNKADHQLSRAEIGKCLMAVQSMNSQSSEWNPKMMAAISDILRIVGEHYDQARKSSEEIKNCVDAIPGSIPVAALPAPQEYNSAERATYSPEKFDDTAIHAKLDSLVGIIGSAQSYSTQAEAMKEIQEQLVATMENMEAFMKNQNLATAASREVAQNSESQELAVAVEKQMSQKAAVEADIVRLSNEKFNLAASVEALRQETRDLTNQRAKVQADLKSLETALRLRREEMDHMEARAENLERRVIEGVLDHSRSLLLSSRPGSSLKSMNLKRVSSSTSSTATVTTGKESHLSKPAPSISGSAVSSAVSMALKKRQPNQSGNTIATKGNRRIMSLSAASGNRLSATERGLTVANPGLTSSKVNSPYTNAIKRSHSVKSNVSSRKSSWGGPKRISLYNNDSEDKENSLLEEDEGEGGDLAADRRTSYTGTCTGTDASYETESLVGGRSRSCSGSIVSSQLDDDDEEEEDEGIEGQQGDDNTEAVANRQYEGDIKEVVLYSTGKDSALGTEPPTATLEASGVLFAGE